MLRKPNSFTKKNKKVFKLNGNLIEAVSIAGLAKMIGKSRDTILRYERSGIFPTPPLMFKNVRYYPIRLVNELIPIIKEFPNNRPPKADLIARINRVFNEERQRLCQNQN